MNVDIEVYLSNIVKFFKDNPKDLLNLIPKEKEQEFYKKIRSSSIKNYERGDDYILTRKQIIDICVELNTTKNESVKEETNTIEELKEKLKLAVENEEYEEAARLRDLIKNN